MKTRLALLITMALLAVGLPMPAFADSLFRYTVSGGEATIIGYDGLAPAKLNIPAEITDSDGTYPVTTIGGVAFYSNELTKLTLPDSITSIGNRAFYGNQLTELTLPDGITSIATFAFSGNQLAEITLPSTLASIASGAFSDNVLTEITLPNTFTTIGSYAFSRNQLTEFTVPDSVTTIGDGAFDRNPLTSVVLGSGLSSIGDAAFGTQVTTARFTGEAPEMGDAVFGSSDPTVRFPWKFGAAQATGGYTTPTWKGYDTFAVADVTFIGGGGIATQSLDVDGTTAAVKPTDPVKFGHVFSGWFAPSTTTPFDFTTPITGDVALTAGFEPQAAPVLTGAATAAVKLGDAFTWTPTTLTGYPTPTVTTTRLPDGLTIDSKTGVITGIVTDAAEIGDHYFTITASNGVYPKATFDLTISIEGFTFTIADGAATITGRHGTALTALVIPAQITDSGHTYPVTAIGNGAFPSQSVTDLDLPGTVTTIGNWAFDDNQLTDLTLPGTLTTIGHDAFAGNQLTELALPGTLTTISDQAFFDNQLTELSVPASVNSIGTDAFGTNPELDDVRFAGTAPLMGDNALGTSDPTVRFPWKFGDPRARLGYTTPTWNGYDTIAVADVTFTGGGNFATQSLDVGGTTKAVKPADPVKAGHVFTGWFADSSATPFDFTTPIAGDVALTAGFEALPSIPDAPAVPAIPADAVISGLAPAITGNAREGKTLTAKPGTLSPANATVTYQWRANGKTIKGATKPKLTLRKAQAGKRITVTLTARAAGSPTVTKTSAKTKPVSSSKRRLVLSTYTVGKNQPFTVTATGFKARQKVVVWLGGNNRYVGRADSRGVLTKTVKFAQDIQPGIRRVRVSGYQAGGYRDRTIWTTVKYR